MAYEGRGPFAAQGPFVALRALGSLYPELVHIVVRDDPALRGVRDLKGKTIALGPEGSAVRGPGLHGRGHAVCGIPARFERRQRGCRRAGDRRARHAAARRTDPGPAEAAAAGPGRRQDACRQ
ncbi:hypothetical protein G6F35_017559 [Rhizopus arrhizus]|nr:hypothetical protein G6F35_017559 [Rhizopus arrhizus]